VQAFPPGKHYAVPPLPNVTAVNSLGGFHIAADRLAFIDGEGTPVTHSSRICADAFPVDPWRPYTPHSTYGGAMERDDTLLRPFNIILGTLFLLSCSHAVLKKMVCYQVASIPGITLR
jgi:hypothetical protein